MNSSSDKVGIEMRLFETTLAVPSENREEGLLARLSAMVESQLAPTQTAIRVVVTEMSRTGWNLEVGVLDGASEPRLRSTELFRLRKRKIANSEEFNAVLLIPTGVGAELGGHSGDGGALAVAMASLCDNLITHPNVVNASDINELPPNGLYVEGSLICRLLMGTVGLEKVRSNRVLVVLDDHPDRTIVEHSINAASAARAAMGFDCTAVLKTSSLRMSSEYSASGRAVGRVDGLGGLIAQIEEYQGEFDAVALSSRISVPKSFHHDYYLGKMVNPWGGVEAMLTHAISTLLDVPSAHSPMMESQEIMNLALGVVDPRMAAEVVSVTYLHSILKGLHRSPRVVTAADAFAHRSVIAAEDISCLVIPDKCVGLPTIAALEQGIPVIAVRENRNLMRNDLSGLSFPPRGLFVVDSYLEALGLMSALKSGVAVESIRRPLEHTRVVPELEEEVASEFGKVIRLRAR